MADLVALRASARIAYAELTEGTDLPAEVPQAKQDLVELLRRGQRSHPRQVQNIERYISATSFAEFERAISVCEGTYALQNPSAHTDQAARMMGGLQPAGSGAMGAHPSAIHGMLDTPRDDQGVEGDRHASGVAKQFQVSDKDLEVAGAILAGFDGLIALSEIGGGMGASSALIQAKTDNPQAPASVGRSHNPYSRADSDRRYGQPLTAGSENPYASIERVRRQLLFESIAPQPAGATQRSQLVLANSAVTERNHGVVWIGARLAPPEGDATEAYVKCRLNGDSIRGQKQAIGAATLELGRQLVGTDGPPDLVHLGHDLSAHLGSEIAVEIVSIRDANGSSVRGEGQTAPVNMGVRPQELRQQVATHTYANPVDRKLARINKSLKVRQLIDEVGEPLGFAQRVSALPFSSIYGASYYEDDQVRARAMANEFDVSVGRLTDRQSGVVQLNFRTEQILARRRLEHMGGPPDLQRSCLIVAANQAPNQEALRVRGLFVVRAIDGAFHSESFAFTVSPNQASPREKALELIADRQTRMLTKLLGIDRDDLD